MPRIITSALCLLACVSALSRAQSPSSSPSVREPEITAGGRGEVRIAPDYAYVMIGVTTQSQNAMETASENARKIAATISAMHALGLTDQQVITSGYSLSPTYEYPKNAQPKLSGFTARNTVRAEVRRLDDLGKVIDAAVSAGATDISSIQYLASSTDDARRKALADAVLQARAEADAIAHAAGGSLGRLIVANSGEISQPGYRGVTFDEVIVTGAMAGGMAQMAPPTPVVPGELRVVAQVFTRWEFVGGPAKQ
ncbi:MAG: SIMPL domain-containing protein [Gemmatimonadaceae bacterium]